MACGCGWTYPYGFVIEEGCSMHDRNMPAQELAAFKRTEMAWEWLLAFKSDDKRLTDENVAEFLSALDKAGAVNLTPPETGNYQNPPCGEFKP